MNIQVRAHDKFTGVFQVIHRDKSSRLATMNLAPEISVYGEQLVKYANRKYRLWNPYKSKLAAAILRKLPNLPIKSKDKVLYLGASSGTTISHISDIIGHGGGVYAVEFSARSLRDLIRKVSSPRTNVFPILADARLPSKYRFLVEQVDCVYCDVAQPEQARILADNAKMFLKNNGTALLAIKGRSIKSTGDLAKIFQKETTVLKQQTTRFGGIEIT